MVIVLAALAYFFPLVPALEHVSAWLGGLGVIGAALFAVLIAVSSLCLLPASPFIIAASAVFGFSLGLLTSSVGIILGASSGYLLSRLFLRKDLADQLKGRPTFKAIDQAIAEEGWKIVLLLRFGQLSLWPHGYWVPSIPAYQFPGGGAGFDLILSSWFRREGRPSGASLRKLKQGCRRNRATSPERSGYSRTGRPIAA